MINSIKRLVEENFNEIVKIRRHLHKNPELSFHEHKTSKSARKATVFTCAFFPFKIINLCDF